MYVMHDHFPLRLPISRLKDLYSSPKEAFDAGDYLYAARFGAGEPETRGLALLMIGNRSGGERILDRHDIRSGRAAFYRTFAAGRSGEIDEARRWIAEARHTGLAPNMIVRLEHLFERERFRIVLHSDIARDPIMDLYQGLPRLDVIPTRLIGNNPLPVDQPLRAVVPSGPSVDLVVIDDLVMLPLGVAELGAPVVVSMHDQEWYYDRLNALLPEIDCLTLSSSSEFTEVARPFGTDAVLRCHYIDTMPPDIKGLARRFLNGTPRDIDLLFTGGLLHDFYRDKRQRILGLTEIDPAFNVKLVEGYLKKSVYMEYLNRSRFGVSAVRLTNYGSTRAVDIVSQGGIALLDEECGTPFMYSEDFPCFQTYRNDHALEDVEHHLRRYPDLIASMKPRAEQLEREMADLYCTDPERAARSLRHLLFVTHVQREGRRKPALTAPRRIVDFLTPEVFAACPVQLDALLDLWTPDRAGDQPLTWQRRAMIRRAGQGVAPQTALAELLDGLSHHPDSLALPYMRALLQIAGGDIASTIEDLETIVRGVVVLHGNEVFPRQLDPIHGCYWTADARIRDRNPDLAPLVPEIDVWKSVACTHLANINLDTATLLAPETHGPDEATPYELAELHRANLDVAVFWAGKALALFSGNGEALRRYLRSLPALSRYRDLPARADAFLSMYNRYRRFHPMIHHDFATMAVDLLHRLDRAPEANAILAWCGRSIARAIIPPEKFELYPETIEC